MERYTIDLDHYRKQSAYRMLSREALLHENPQLAVRQHDIWMTICADQEMPGEDEDGGDGDVDSLGTSPGLFPFPYFPDELAQSQNDGGDREFPASPQHHKKVDVVQGHSDGELALASDQSGCQEAVTTSLNMSAQSETVVECAKDSQEIIGVEDSHGVLCNQLEHSTLHNIVCPTEGGEGEIVSHRLSEELMRQGPYAGKRKPIIAPLVRCERPLLWRSRRQPAYFQ